MIYAESSRSEHHFGAVDGVKGVERPDPGPRLVVGQQGNEQGEESNPPCG